MGNNGFTLTNMIIFLALSGLLTAVAIPIDKNFQEKAIMSEAEAGLKYVSTQLHAYAGLHGNFPGLTADSTLAGATWNSIEPGYLSKRYFEDTAYTVESSDSTFTITCNTGNKLAFMLSLDDSGVIRKL